MINRISIYIVPIILILYGKGGGVGIGLCAKKIGEATLHSPPPPPVYATIYNYILYRKGWKELCEKWYSNAT